MKLRNRSFKNFETKLHEACLNDNLRPNLQYIIFEKGYAVCTNTHIFVKQHLSIHGFTEDEIKQLEGKAIHKDVFKEIYRYDWVTVEDNYFVCIRGNVTAKFEIEDKPENYPAYEKIIPNGEPQKIDRIGISFVELERVLKIVANIYAFKRVEFKFYSEYEPILIKSVDNDWSDETIMLMPIALIK